MASLPVLAASPLAADPVSVVRKVEADGTHPLAHEIVVDAPTAEVWAAVVGYPDSEGGRRLVGFFEAGNKVSLESLRRRFAEGPVDWAGRPRGR